MHVWSDETPLEETLSALDYAVTTGRASYVGVSNYCGWQTAQAATWQRAVPGRAPLASNQVEYSLLNRRVEHEMSRPPRRSGWACCLVAAGRGRADREVPHRHPGGLPGGVAALLELRRRLPRRALRAASSRPWRRAAEGLQWSPLEVALAWVRDRPGVPRRSSERGRRRSCAAP